MKAVKNLYLKVFGLFIIASLGCSVINVQPSAADMKAIDKELVVLMHGLGRSNTAMWKLASRLEDAGYFVVRVGYRSFQQTPEQILESITAQINACCTKHKHAVHFVGHSLGGLLTRAYLQNNKVDHLGRVVLLASPNHGTEVVDQYRERWWMKFAGPMAMALGTDENSFPHSLEPPYYPVGVIAGINGDEDNDKILPGKDDGLVTVESTKLQGMTDFIIIESGHSLMRYNEEVAKQTIAFIKYEKFLK